MRNERRRATRYRFSAPVHVSKSETGLLRDMSISGLFFESGRAYSVGEVVQLSVVLGDSLVLCEGRVARVEPLENKFGIGLELTSYDFQILKELRSSAQKQKIK